ncbi:MAG: hypothetical protein ACM3ML_23740 [Micromonosporaceae bacterium]
MRKLIVLLLLIPLITVMATKDPKGVGQVVQVIITAGAWLLEMAAELLNQIANALGGVHY